jgi:chromosome segregation ATPase
MSTTDPPDTAPEDPAHQEPAPDKDHGPWLWVSLALGALAIGLLVWGLAKSSDLNSAQKQLDQQAEAGNAVVTTAQNAYEDVTKDLAVTSQQLDATTQDTEAAKQQADQAQEDADAAQEQADQAGDQTAKAEAQAAEAQAQTKAAESKAQVATGCAKAYVSAIGTLFEGSDIKAQAAAVGEQLEGIAADCKEAFEGA